MFEEAEHPQLSEDPLTRNQVLEDIRHLLQSHLATVTWISNGPDNTKSAITNGAVRLHFCRAGHLTGRVAVGLRHCCSAAGAPSKSCGVTRGPSRGGGSSQARRSTEARGGGSAGGVDTEILVAQLRARKQVSTDGLPACTVKCHPSSHQTPETVHFVCTKLLLLGAEETRLLTQHDYLVSWLVGEAARLTELTGSG